MRCLYISGMLLKLSGFTVGVGAFVLYFVTSGTDTRQQWGTVEEFAVYTVYGIGAGAVGGLAQWLIHGMMTSE